MGERVRGPHVAREARGGAANRRSIRRPPVPYACRPMRARSARTRPRPSSGRGNWRLKLGRRAGTSSRAHGRGKAAPLPPARACSRRARFTSRPASTNGPRTARALKTVGSALRGEHAHRSRRRGYERFASHRAAARAHAQTRGYLLTATPRSGLGALGARSAPFQIVRRSDSRDHHPPPALRSPSPSRKTVPSRA